MPLWENKMESMLGGQKFAKKKHSYTQALQDSQMDYFNAQPPGMPENGYPANTGKNLSEII
jgi:hypothetical protein